MNVNTISIPKEQAKQQFELYHGLLKDQRSKEDEAIARAYKACAKGQVLLNIQDVIRDAGVNEQGLPKLAIARADAEWVYYNNAQNALPRYITKTLQHRGLTQPDWWCHKFHRVILRNSGFPDSGNCISSSWHKALVPIVPPQFRPRWKMSNYHILFEAVWEKMPPVDPILLRHLGGDLYVVLAQWDLTEVERAVLSQRFN